MTTVTIVEQRNAVTVEEGVLHVTPVEQETAVTVSLGGVTDHGALSGLADDDHPQYLLKAGGTMTGALTLAGAPSADLHAATKLYVDTEVAGAGGGASDVGDLTTTGLTAGNMLRVAAAGGLEERTPAEVLGDIGAAASADLADYLPLTGTVTGDTQFNAGVALRGNIAASATEIAALSFYNNTNLVAKIAVLSTDTTRDDGTIVFSTAINTTLTEKFRIPRDGVVDFPAAGYTVGGVTVGMSNSNFTAVLTARNGINVYSALLGRDYAAFNAHPANTYGAFLSPGSGRTNQIFNILELRHDTSGIPAAGFGAGLAFQLDSSTTENQNAARIAAVWTEATHATRKADLVLSAYDTAEREGLRIRATGSAALLITSLPTSDPMVAGALWSNGGVVTVSAA